MTDPTPQQLVEAALSASTSEHCIAIVEDSSSANLRWANNTLTTNGAMHAVQVTVIAFQGKANASVTGSAASLEQVRTLVEAADRTAADEDEAEDYAELVPGEAAADWDEPPAGTSIGVYADFARDLGDELDRADKESRVLYGFVNHEVSTSYLGSSTGLRLRHVQPTGHYGCTGKTADLSRSAWVGGATRDSRRRRSSPTATRRTPPASTTTACPWSAPSGSPTAPWRP